MAPTLKDAKCAYDAFVEPYSPKYPKAVTCLAKDQDVLFTFYSFPAEHWRHLRTTNPIESLIATARHRARQTKGYGSRTATMAMVYKLAVEAQKHWRRYCQLELTNSVWPAMCAECNPSSLPSHCLPTPHTVAATSQKRRLPLSSGCIFDFR